MKYVILSGFFDQVENRGYRRGELVEFTDKTNEERIGFLTSRGFIAPEKVETEVEPESGKVEPVTPAVEPVKSDEGEVEPVTPKVGVQVETDGLEALELADLKAEADKLQLTYSNNIGKDTLIEKIRAFKKGE